VVKTILSVKVKRQEPSGFFALCVVILAAPFDSTSKKPTGSRDHF